VGPRNLVWAAASSRASGSPSSLQQIAATAAALARVSSKAGEASVARSTKSFAAGVWVNSPASGIRVGSGTARGETEYSCSPRTLNGARLVTRTQRLGQEPRRSTTSGAASETCSKLSSTRRNLFSRRCWRRASRGCMLPTSLRPNTCETVGITSAASPRGANPTKATPSGKPPAAFCAASMTRRVFPIPPGPVSVSSRTPAGRRSRFSISSTSRSRPSRGVSEAGRIEGDVAASPAGRGASPSRLVTASARRARSPSGSPRASARDLTV